MEAFLLSETSVCRHKPALCQKPEDYNVKFPLFLTIKRYSRSPATILQFRETGATSVGEPSKLYAIRGCDVIVLQQAADICSTISSQQRFHGVRKYANIVFSFACCPFTGRSGTMSQ
jgi:hypothetical protein